MKVGYLLGRRKKIKVVPTCELVSVNETDQTRNKYQAEAFKCIIFQLDCIYLKILYCCTQIFGELS